MLTFRKIFIICLISLILLYPRTKYTVCIFGDSISESLAFWSPLAYQEIQGLSPDLQNDISLAREYTRAECWRWHGKKYGNASGKTICWALENIDRWLLDLQPDVVIIMFGTNDIISFFATPLTEFESKYCMIINKIKSKNVIPILSTLPPMQKRQKTVEKYNTAILKIAKNNNCQVVNYHAEIMQIAPKTWHNTMISKDGIHPTIAGYEIRNLATVRVYAEVIKYLNER